MATYQITSAANVTDLTGKAGADTYLVNGGTLVFDCDTRVGINQGQPFGNITVSATLGGTVKFDGKKVRLVPFSGGVGAVPAPGTMITQGASTVELLCVMESRTGGALHTGSMPATGWLKVRGTGITAGQLTGIGALASGPDESGWLVLAGSDTRTLTIPRLGKFVVDGDWFNVGTTTGVRGQTLQLPHFSAESATYYPGVVIGNEFWPNAGKQYDGISIDKRGRFCHISATGLVTLGGSGNGMIPAPSLQVKIPNIILQTAATNKQHNSEPHDVMGVRYETAFGGSGVMDHSLSTGAWFWNIAQSHSLSLSHLHSCDQVSISRVATKPAIDHLHVGLSTRNVAMTGVPLTIQNCTAGGTIGTISAVRATCTTTSGYVTLLTALSGVWSIQNVDSRTASNPTAVAGPLFINACEDVTVHNLVTTGKRVLVSGGARVTIHAHEYSDTVTGATNSTEGSHALEVLSTVDCHYLGLTSSGTDTHPKNGLVYAANTKGLRVRGIGTELLPYNGGTGSNSVAQIWSDGGNNTDFRIERNWVTDTRNGVASPNSSSSGGFVQNNYLGNATRTAPTMQSNTVFRGNRHNGGNVPTTYSGTYGTTMWDAFTSDTTTRMALVFSEPLVSDGDYEVIAGSPKFTGQGGMVMQSGDSAVWTSHQIKGWQSLASVGTSGQNAGLFSMEYRLDRGDGWGTYKALTNANLLAESALNSLGFKIRIKITCTASNYANHLTGVWVNGSTSLAAQNAALYPLDEQTAALNIHGMQFGSRLVVSYGDTQFFAANTVGGSAQANFPIDNGREHLDVSITKDGYAPVLLRLPNADGQSITVTQQTASSTSVGGTGGSGTPEGDIAAAVQAILLDDFAAIDARISNTMHDAYDPNKEWFVLTKDGQHLVGVTTQNPYVMGLQEGMSVAEFSGQIPDLNFSAWDFGNDVFKSTLTPRLNFMSRFTVAELAAIRNSTDLTVKDIMERMDVQKYINTLDQLTIDSVNYLATLGLIAPERTSEILT